MRRQVECHAEILSVLGIYFRFGNGVLTWTLMPSVDFVIPQRSVDSDATWMLNDVLVPDLLSTSKGPFMSSVLKPGNSTSSTSCLEAAPGSSWCRRVNILLVQLDRCFGVKFSKFETVNLSFEAGAMFHTSYIPHLLTKYQSVPRWRPPQTDDIWNRMLKTRHLAQTSHKSLPKYNEIQ